MRHMNNGVVGRRLLELAGSVAPVEAWDFVPALTGEPYTPALNLSRRAIPCGPDEIDKLSNCDLVFPRLMSPFAL